MSKVDWRTDVENVPKDGTEVLLAIPVTSHYRKVAYVAASWCAVMGEWQTSFGRKHIGERDILAYCQLNAPNTPEVKS